MQINQAGQTGLTFEVNHGGAITRVGGGKATIYPDDFFIVNHDSAFRHYFKRTHINHLAAM